MTATSPTGSTIRWCASMAGATRLLRRARGFAPAPISLPPGFEAAPDLLAMGGELKATFCLVKDGEAILSQHHGDLEDAATFDDYRKNLALYASCSIMRRPRSSPIGIPNICRPNLPASGRDACDAADRSSASSRPCRGLPGGERPRA